MAFAGPATGRRGREVDSLPVYEIRHSRWSIRRLGRCAAAGHRTRRRPGTEVPGRRVTRSADQEMRILADVPLSDTTRIFTPTAGSLTPWFGSSS